MFDDGDSGGVGGMQYILMESFATLSDSSKQRKNTWKLTHDS